MKKNFNYVLAFVLSIALFNSCSKDDDSNNTTAPTKTQLLTAHSWKLTGLTVNGTDQFASVDACEKDNLYTFQSNGTGTLDEGASKCDPADPQTTNLTWAFASNETILTLNDGSGALDLTLATLTSDQLRLSITDTSLGIPLTVVQTFGKP
ncbi:MAG: lipocalin family protein [Bacteroidota bacterium]